MTALKLREKRAGVWEQSKKLLDKVESEDRNFNAEEQESWDKMQGDIDSMKSRIDRAERSDGLEKELNSPIDNKPIIQRDNEHRAGDNNPETENREAKRREALRGWFLENTDNQTDEMRQAAQDTGLMLGNGRMTFRLSKNPPSDIRKLDEYRAQSVGTTTEGGFTVPEGFVAQVEKSLLAFGGMRRAARILRTDTGNDLPIPTVSDTSNSGVILDENTVDTEQDTTFGQVILNAYKYTSKIIRVSIELLQDSAIDIEQLLGELLGERIGRATNAHFTTGTGSGQPNGVVTASSTGVTGATGQTLSVIYDDLVDLQHSVDPSYREGNQVRYMMNDASLAIVRKLKDDNSNPIWNPGVTGGAPDMLLGFPYIINQSMASMAANAKSILFGDFSKYWIRDVMDLTLVRMVERYADFHQVAFVVISRHDGELIDAGTDPIKHYKNSAT